jgi:hypothetical protein
MKKQTNKPTKTPSVVSAPTHAPVTAGGCTLGLDLGDRSHYVCVLDVAGLILHEGLLPNDRRSDSPDFRAPLAAILFPKLR